MNHPEKEKQEKPEEQLPPEKSQSPAPQAPGIVQPMIDELLPRPQPSDIEPPERGPVHPPQPAELDQDPGGGYNPDHTIPQP